MQKNKVTENTKVKHNTYAPDMRNFLEPAPEDLISGEGKTKTTLPDHLESFEIRNKIVKTMVKGSKKIISINCENGILEMNLDQEVVAIDEKKDNIESATYNAKLLGKENIKFVYGQPIKKMVTFAKKKVYDTVIIQGVNGISNELKDTLRLGKVQTVIYMNSSTSMLAKYMQEI